MLLLGLYCTVCILIYYLEGTHDAYITLETNEHPPAKDYFKANHYKGLWHTYDTISYTIFHIAGAALASLLAVQDMARTHCLGLLLISVSVRIICHDLFFDLGVKRSPFTIPTCQGGPARYNLLSVPGWDWWDYLLVRFYKLTGLNPFLFKFIPLIISITIYLIII